MYPLAEVRFLVPVLRPPSIRIFDGYGLSFRESDVRRMAPMRTCRFPWRGSRRVLRPAAVIGADEQIGGFTAMNDWHAAELRGRRRTTSRSRSARSSSRPTSTRLPGVDWDALVDHARRNTELLPGDVVAADAVERVEVARGEMAELGLEGVGVLRNRLA